MVAPFAGALIEANVTVHISIARKSCHLSTRKMKTMNSN
jgi:hypothetical protein